VRGLTSREIEAFYIEVDRIRYRKMTHNLVLPKDLRRVYLPYDGPRSSHDTSRGYTENPISLLITAAALSAAAGIYLLLHPHDAPFPIAISTQTCDGLAIYGREEQMVACYPADVTERAVDAVPRSVPAIEWGDSPK